MSDRAFGVDHPPRTQRGLNYFDIEVHDGVYWMTVNDTFRYRATARALESSTQQRRRKMVSSSMYDGEWEVHSTLGNVEEKIEIDVYGADQVEVTENLQKVIAAFSQRVYNVRVTRDNAREIWRCFPAEYSITRGQINSHNRRATIALSISRFPKVTYEVMS